MHYTIDEKNEIILVGMKYYGNNANNEIRKLWDEFRARMGEIENRVNAIDYGYDTWTDDINKHGKFTYIAGVEVSDDSCIPNGMELIKIPSNRYAIFKIEKYKEIPNFDEVIRHICTEVIPNEGLQICNNYDFEVFDDQDIYFHVPVSNSRPHLSIV